MSVSLAKRRSPDGVCLARSVPLVGVWPGAGGAQHPAATPGRSKLLCLAQGCASPGLARLTLEATPAVEHGGSPERAGARSGVRRPERRRNPGPHSLAIVGYTRPCPDCCHSGCPVVYSQPFGGVPERPIGAVSKTVVGLVPTVGSNPTPSATDAQESRAFSPAFGFPLRGRPCDGAQVCILPGRCTGAANWSHGAVRARLAASAGAPAPGRHLPSGAPAL